MSANINTWSERRKLKSAFANQPQVSKKILCSLRWSPDKHLSYIGHECCNIPDILSKSYGEIAKRLDLSYNKISDLSGLQRFILLEELVLDNNELNDEIDFPINPLLTTLSLNKNQLNNLEGLLEKLTECFPNLTYLSLLGNKACPNQLSSAQNDDDDYQRYRYFVIFKLPKLKFLDSTPIKKNEKLEAFRVGEYMKVARPSAQQVRRSSKAGNTSDALPYSPLPLAATKEGIHTGAYGQRKHMYSGKHSEGNRFIRNNDL